MAGFDAMANLHGDHPGISSACAEEDAAHEALAQLSSEHCLARLDSLDASSRLARILGYVNEHFLSASAEDLRSSRNGPELFELPGRCGDPSVQAAICLVNGTDGLTSILRGSAAAAKGAVSSKTPLTNSAVSFSATTPSGRGSVRSKTP